MASKSPDIRFGDAPLTIEDVVALSQRQAQAVVSDDPAFQARIQKGADFLDRLLREEGVIYGVTTGYGDSCTVNIPPALVAEMVNVCDPKEKLLPDQLPWHDCALPPSRLQVTVADESSRAPSSNSSTVGPDCAANAPTASRRT